MIIMKIKITEYEHDDKEIDLEDFDKAFYDKLKNYEYWINRITHNELSIDLHNRISITNSQLTKKLRDYDQILLNQTRSSEEVIKAKDLLIAQLQLEISQLRQKLDTFK